MMLLSFGLLLLAASAQSVVEKFGCNFINNEYGLSDNVVQSVRYEDNLIQPIQLHTEEQLETLVLEIRLVYLEMMKELKFNSMDDYLGFFDDYERLNRNVNFHQFFRNYKPRYRSGVNSVELVIQTLNRISERLSQRYRTISQHIFMAAGQEGVFIDTPTLHALNETYLGTENGQRITHIFGVVKFMLGTRLGHILFDSGCDIPNYPLVLMHDGQRIIEGYKSIYDPERNGLTYTVLETNRFFVIAKDGFIGDRRTKLDYLIYLGYPYCSPMDITKKYEILKFDRYLVRRFEDGEPRAGIFFYNLHNLDSNYKLIAKASSINRFHAFILSDVSRRKTELLIPYARFDVPRNQIVILPNKEKEILDQVARKLNMSTFDLCEQLKRVYKLTRNVPLMTDINDYAMFHKKQSIELYIKPKSMRKTKKRKF